MLINISNGRYIPFKINIIKIIKVYVAACAFIPSNILKALINNKKHSTVKKNENFSIWNVLSVKENTTFFINKSLSRIIEANINIVIAINFESELRSFLSSTLPRKKNKDIIIIKLTN